MELRICRYLLFVLFIFSIRCLAHPILDTIPTFPQLSTLQSLIGNSSSITNILQNADNFTFIAPTNTAIQNWLAKLSTPPTEQDIEAILRYHTLKGVISVSSITATPQFIHSFENITDFNRTNVTSGQAMELVLNSAKKPVIMSGNFTNSSITTADVEVAGGLMQLVDTVSLLPEPESVVVRDAQLSFFIGLLAKAGFFLNNVDSFTAQVVNMPDTTYFTPNTAEALAQFPTGANQTKLTQILSYHIVPGFIGYSTALNDKMTLKSLEGKDLTIRVASDGTKFVNDAKILRTDLLVSNGVVHTIDTLLDPANITEVNLPAAPLPPASIAGIVIGIVVFLAAIGVLAFFLIKRHRNRLYNRSTRNGSTGTWDRSNSNGGMIQLGSSSSSPGRSFRDQISRPRLLTAFGSSSSNSPFASTRNNSDATALLGPGATMSPIQGGNRNGSSVRTGSNAGSEADSSPIAEMAAGRQSRLNQFGQVVTVPPPAELDAVKTRANYKSFETEVHELGVPTPRSSRSPAQTQAQSQIPVKSAVERKIMTQEQWERYPAEKYSSPPDTNRGFAEEKGGGMGNFV